MASDEAVPFKKISGSSTKIEKTLAREIIKYLNSSRRDQFCIKGFPEDRSVEFARKIGQWLNGVAVKRPEPIEVGICPDTKMIVIRKAGRIQ